jgi:hypothetical protein
LLKFCRFGLAGLAGEGKKSPLPGIVLFCAKALLTEIANPLYICILAIKDEIIIVDNTVPKPVMMSIVPKFI